MPVKLLTSGGGGVNLVPSSSIASDVTVTVPSKSGTTVLTDVADNIGIAATGANYITMSTNSTERARIDSSGNLLVGGTQSSTDTKVQVNVNGGNASKAWVGIAANGSNIANQVTGVWFGNTANAIWSDVDGNGTARNQIIIRAGGSGGVQLTSGSASWTSYSDERLKENLQPIISAAAKVSTLRAVTGNFKEDADKKSRSFLISQDVKSVFPEAIDDSIDEAGMLGLRYTDLIPLLVAAIKELSAQNKELTQRIEALEYTKQGE